MNAKEYMVGDWVMDTEPTFYTKVTAGMIYEGYDWEPVPLTEEILMANGFSKNTKFDGIEYYKDGLVLEGNFIRIGRREIRLNYVHELQHLLRICGLNELADNFKIKP